MPDRGRDSYYLESMIGFCNLAIGLLCVIFQAEGPDKSVVDLFRTMAPPGVWAVLWGVTGAVLLYGSSTGSNRMIGWGAFISAGLWGSVAFNSLRDPRYFPMASALTPIFFTYSGAIFVYQSFVAKGHRGHPEWRR